MTATAVGEIGMGASVAGGLTSALGSIFTGESQQKMYNYQAGVAQLNSQIALQNADYSREVGEQQATVAGLRGAQTKGQIKVAQASSGLDVNSGSAVEVQKSQAKMTSLDLDTIRSNAARTAYNYDVQSTQDIAQSKLYKAAGANAMAAGEIGAASSILGTAGSVSNEWLTGQRMGLWGSSGGSNSLGAGAPTNLGGIY